MKNIVDRIKRRLQNNLEDISKKIYVRFIRILPNKYGIKKSSTNEVIVSLTSYPKRFDKIHLCIKSLMYQTVRPNKIILWLGSDSINIPLPNELEKLKKYGLEIIYKNEDLKPHKKYYYAFQEFPDSIVITVDDDVIYSPTMISSLLRTHYKYPNVICARRVHDIICTQNSIAKYEFWNQGCQTKLRPCISLMAVGVGGVLYPPNTVNKLVLNKKMIMEKCLNADDLWLKFMEVLQNTAVVWCPCLWAHPANIEKNQHGLCDSNVGECRNDIYMKGLVQLFPSVVEIIKNEKE